MLVRIASLTERPLSFFRSISYRRIDSTPNSASREMNFDDLDSDGTKCVNLRLCNVSGCMTEILEIHADQPSLHVVFVPGNPGAITFYKEFVESLFEFLGGTASLLSYVSDQLLALQVIQKRLSLRRSRVLSTTVTLFVALLGLLPRRVLRVISELSNGKSWSNTAHEAACSHLPQYHTIRNVLYMARTEFIKLSETPDWNFMRENQEKISFLYGIDDHWGPLQMFEEVSRQASGIALSIEREGHTHGFCCSEAGSIWVARHAASLIKNKLAN
ncbi:hypothetical protein V6N12_024667 [Hibiscus sabdariffa]|uniref:Uncharacterized protein n=1 Tax=Hibiscus sabdariffa TaxID=183260 RepID=A0ABR2G1Q9_9ROSI